MSFLDGMIGIRTVRDDATEQVTQRDTVHFVGSRFTLADDATAGETVLTVLDDESAPPVAITPPTITTDQTYYAPTDWDTATLVRLSATGTPAIHGFAPPSLIGDPRKTLAMTGGMGNVEIKHLSSTTTASARVVCPYGASYYLQPWGSVDILYDDALGVWRLVP